MLTGTGFDAESTANVIADNECSNAVEQAVSVTDINIFPDLLAGNDRRVIVATGSTRPPRQARKRRTANSRTTHIDPVKYRYFELLLLDSADKWVGPSITRPEHKSRGVTS